MTSAVVNIYHGCKKMIGDEVDGNYCSQPNFFHSEHDFVHDDGPALLSQNLKHGHEGLVVVEWVKVNINIFVSS